MAPYRNWDSLNLKDWHATHNAILQEASLLLQQIDSSHTVPVHSFSRLLKRVQIHCASEARSLYPKLPDYLQVVLHAHHDDIFQCTGSDVCAKAKWLRELTTRIILEEELVWDAVSHLKQ
jgi:hypothetical protein